MRDRTKLYIGLFILLGTVALGAWQWNQMQALKITANTLNSESTTLTAIEQTLIEDYQLIKADLASVRETSTQEIEFVFPTDENLTALTRMFDDFAVKNNFSTNPFFISSINYASSQMDADGYRYVPVSLNVTASKSNLDEFLDFVENSGSLEGETRLMSVEEMTVGYPVEYGGTYDIKFKINAYFSQEI